MVAVGGAITSNSLIETVAGTGVAGNNGDGGQATATQLNYPTDMAVDAAGDLYIADLANNRVLEVNANTQTVITVDSGYHVQDLALDAAGDLFMSGTQDNIIREKPAGSLFVATIGGTGSNGFNNDGPSLTTQLNFPRGLAVDASGDLFVADTNNDIVREIAVPLPFIVLPPLTTFTVTNTSDSGDGSLRQAILDADANSVGHNLINFNIPTSDPGYSNGVYTITLAGTELPQITDDVNITGLGASQLIVSGNNQSQVFSISNSTVAISGISVIGGNSTYGGGLFSVGSSTNLTIINSVFSDNTATYGGAIYTRDGTVTLSGDTFTNNTASVESGAVDNWAGGLVTATGDTFVGNSALYGGAIGNEWGTVRVADSTFNANSATTGAGGAILNYNPNDGFNNGLSVVDSTLTGNSAVQGGGIATSSNDTLTLDNAIVSGNTASTANPNILGMITTDDGYNLVGVKDGSSGLSASTDLSGTAASPLNAPLSPLGYYGGPTETMAPLPGSPAIGTGDNNGGPATDQRGFARSTGAGGDIGADESLYYVVNTTADSDDGSAAGATISLRDAIEYGADANPSFATVITFDPSPLRPDDHPGRQRAAADQRGLRDDHRPGCEPAHRQRRQPEPRLRHCQRRHRRHFRVDDRGRRRRRGFRQHLSQ